MQTQNRIRKHRITKGSVFCNIILMLFTISCIFPLIWTFYSSLKTRSEFAQNIISLPKSPQFSNYLEVFRISDMPLYMLNSLRNSVISVALIVIIAFVTGYLISRFRFRGRGVIYGYYVFGLLVPIHALMVPLFLLYESCGLNDRWYTLVLPYVAFGLPFAVFLMENYIASIPKEMEEAAVIEGCSFLRTLFTIIFPMAMPVITTVVIMQFFTCWNEFPFGLVLLRSDNLRTVSVGLTIFKAQQDMNYPLLMAAIITSLAPAAILYFILSDKIIKGVVAGAVKG